MHADSIAAVCRLQSCGKTFRRSPARMGPYCSRDCHHQAQRRPLAERFWEKVERSEGCWLWNGSLNNSGHGTLCARTEQGTPTCAQAHRISWEIHYGAIPAGQVVRHRCDRPRCVNPLHLCLGSQADNNRDRWARGPSLHRDAPARGPRAKAAIRLCARCTKPFHWHAARPSRCCSLECAYILRTQDVAERFWSKVEKTADCWLWTASVTGSGYGMFAMKPNHWRPIVAHRVSWELTVGPIPEGQYVLHRCDNPRCVRPDHLFLGTQRENMADCAAKGRTSRGSEKHRENVQKGEGRYNARLTADDVRSIRALRAAEGVTYRALGERYGVTASVARQIVKRERWKHVE